MRVALALSLAVPALVAWFAAGSMPGTIDDAWWVPASAGALALAWLVVLRRSWALMLVAGGLAALGAQTAGKASVMLDVSTDAATNGTFPFFDLRDGGIPEPVPPYVRVSGFVRGGWTLDEYAVERGDLPDQSAEPIAVLIPVTGTAAPEATGEEPRGNPIDAGVAVVVVRVKPKTVFDGRSPSVLQGKTEPLDPELLGTLVQVQGDPAELRGVLVDTLAVPSGQDAWLEIGLAAIALVVAMACAFVASTPPPAES